MAVGGSVGISTQNITTSGAGLDVTTKGDVQTYSTEGARLAVGTNDQILTADSNEATGLKWADVPKVTTDHGTATTDELVNVCYGTSGTPPTASDTTEGAIYIQYTA